MHFLIKFQDRTRIFTAALLAVFFFLHLLWDGGVLLLPFELIGQLFTCISQAHSPEELWHLLYVNFFGWHHPIEAFYLAELLLLGYTGFLMIYRIPKATASVSALFQQSLGEEAHAEAAHTLTKWRSALLRVVICLHQVAIACLASGMVMWTDPAYAIPENTFSYVISIVKVLFWFLFARLFQRHFEESIDSVTQALGDELCRNRTAEQSRKTE